jgi:hypothetical protein
MPNLDSPFPLSGAFDVPINKIVRCRWRDEEDYEEKIIDNVTRIGEQGWRYPLQGWRLNTVEKWVQYLMTADRETYSKQEVAEEKARTMPLDMVEQWVGHNRVASGHRLGTWFIWSREHEGKRDLVPFVIKDTATLDEARDIFLTDNMAFDGQTLGWAVGAALRIVPEILASGKSKSEAYAWVADRTGLNENQVPILFEMATAFKSGVLGSAAKRLKPDSGVDFWARLQELNMMRLSPVTLDEQKRHVDHIISGPNQQKRVSYLFGKLREEALLANPQAQLPAPPKKKATLPETAIKGLRSAANAFRRIRETDFEYEDHQLSLISNLMQYLNSVAPTVDLAEQFAIQQANAAVYAAQAEEETNDNTVRSSEAHQGL